MNRSGSVVILHRLLFLLVLLAATPVAVAQRAPQRPGSDITQSVTPYNAAQTQTIQQYGTYWAQALTTSTAPEQVERARRELGSTLTGPLAPSALYRREFARTVVPILTAVLNDEDLHKAINAINVLADLRTLESARTLQVHVDSDQQPVMQIRIRAAKGLELTVQYASRNPSLTDIESRDVVAIVRNLEDASASESNALVQRYLLEAMAAGHAGELNAAAKESIRDSLVNALAGMLNNAGNPNPDAEELEAIYVGVFRLYSIYVQLNADQAAQRELGLRAAALIETLIESASHAWEKSLEDRHLRQVYAQVLQLCEQFLRPIDATVRPGQPLPNVPLRERWDDGDQDAFNSAAAQLADVLRGPPYGSR